ncbi:hypothetical protein OG572_15240 [Streptomyces virginiae]|uniref:hypothetical protein n=1 Tax=Streptomyces virginiae TaxID=1961 RepID=UPI0032442800
MVEAVEAVGVVLPLPQVEAAAPVFARPALVPRPVVGPVAGGGYVHERAAARA